MEEISLIESFNEALDKLVGTSCWAFIMGRGTGSMASVDFGAKIPRDVPLSNSHLTETERYFDGEYGLLIENCYWILQSRERVFFDTSISEIDNEIKGEITRHLENKRVVSVRLYPKSRNLIVKFEGGIKLELFCHDDDPKDDNFSFFCGDKVFSVTGDHRIEISKRSGE